MIIDVSQILKSFGESKELSGSIELGEKKASGAEPVFTSLDFCGTVTNIGGPLELKLNVSGKYDVLCSRCAKEIQEGFADSFSEILVSTEAEDITDRDDAVIFSGNTVDLTEIIMSNVLLSLPSTFLCKEDCKGLCPKCGTDLNEKSCDCEDDVDPRWEALKNFVICDSE